jgi:hypothetical protein
VFCKKSSDMIDSKEVELFRSDKECVNNMETKGLTQITYGNWLR